MSWLIPIKIIEGNVIYLQGALSVQKKVMLNAPQGTREAFRPPSFVLNLVELCVDLQKKYLRTKIKNFDRRIQPP